MSFAMSSFITISACPKCYQDLEELYSTSLSSLSEQESETQNLTASVSDLVPFDDRLVQYEMDISDLQNEASDLVRMQNELLVVYSDILFAVNVTIRDRLAQINGSLDDLKRRFTTVYVITYSAQELLNNTISEFVMALDLVRRIEAIDLPSIMNGSELIQSNAVDVAAVARQVESTRANFSAQVEELRNATYEILRLSASILTSAEQLMEMQRGIWEDVENILTTYSSLDSEMDEIESFLPRLEMNLLTVTQRLQFKYDSLPEVPERDEIIYLTRNASETESYIRSEILSEISSQVGQLLALNQSYAMYRVEFEELSQQVSNLREEVSSLLERIRAAFQQASTVAEDINDLIDQSEMVAENLENFNNVTFRVGNEVAEALADVESINENASLALSEVRNIEEALRNLSTDIRSAKEVANTAFNISSSSFQVSSTEGRGGGQWL